MRNLKLSYHAGKRPRTFFLSLVLGYGEKVCCCRSVKDRERCLGISQGAKASRLVIGRCRIIQVETSIMLRTYISELEGSKNVGDW